MYPRLLVIVRMTAARETGGTVADDYSTLDGALKSELKEPVLSGLLAWQQEHLCKLHLIRKFTTGYTDAFVALVAANDAAGGRKVILKADRGSLVDEAKAHAVALEVAPPKFAENHFVTQEYEALRLSDGWFVMFQGIAGGGITELKPLSVYSRRSSLRETMPRIASSVVLEWNPAPTLSKSTLGEFLELHVKKKLHDGGRLWKWAKVEIDPDAVSSTFLEFSDREKTINPFAIFADPRISGFPLQIFTGNIHGDLHMENILVRGRPDQSEFSYRLIDLATYSSSGPLSRDFVNLFLSEVEHAISNFSASERVELLKAITSNNHEVSNAIAPVVDLWSAIKDVGSQQANARGVLDDWNLQITLSLAGAALQSASRSHRKLKDRLWFFELASLTLNSVLTHLNLLPISGDTCSVAGPAESAASGAREAAHNITSACGGFDGECLTVAVMNLPELEQWQISETALSAWNVIVDFNPFSDQNGLFYAATAREPSHRWMTDREGTSANSVSTVWIPGAGLASPSGRTSDLTTLQWRSKEMPQIRNALSGIMALNSGPITIVHFGSVTPKSRAVLEFIFDTVGTRANLVTISRAHQSEAFELEPVEISEDPYRVLVELPPRARRFRGPAETLTVPGGDGRVTITERDLLRYADVGELLHSDVEATLEADTNSEGGFYRGRRITWLELSERRDIPRELFKSLKETVEGLLVDRGTYRHVVKHNPGSGGSTIARRIAWDLHLDHPTLVLDAIPAISPVVERISELAELTSRQCLVVIENALESAVNDLYNHLRARSTPVVLLVVQRRNLLNGAVDQAKGVGLLTVEEQGHFSRVFGTRAASNEARRRIESIGQPGGDPAVPFFYALNAFQANYEGLTPFVKSFIQNQREDVSSSLMDIALVHRFCGRALPAQVVAEFLGYRGSPNSSVRNRFKGLSDGLLLEVPLGCWRTTHPLIAEELLRQGLAHGAGLAPKYWTSALVTACNDLIIRLAEAYDGNFPTVITEILKQLFIARDAREESQSDYRSLFSELIVSIPSYPGRDAVFSTLIEYFPNEPHFLAHYARLKSYQGKEYSGARKLIDAAIDLSSVDPLLFNIKGVVIRNEIDRVLNASPGKKWLDHRDYRERISELLFDAIDSLKRADELDSSTEQNSLLILEMVNRIVPRVKPRDVTFSQFLTRPAAAALADAVDEAEDAADRIEEIYGDFKFSDRVQGALNNLKGIKDDHAGMLQGWRGILDTTQGPKTPIRSRLARIYWEKSSYGKDAASRKGAFLLLNENLRDDPYDARSIRMWLKVGRLEGSSLDQAAIYCSNWVERQPEREAYFYDWAISALLLLSGRARETNDYHLKLKRLRATGEDMRNFRDVFEWIGFGEDLGQLVSGKDARLLSWDRRDRGAVEPDFLRRVDARVTKIIKPQSGLLELDDGLEAFFTPAFSGLRKGQDEGALVTAFVGLSHDGLIAWSVRKKDAGPSLT